MIVEQLICLLNVRPLSSCFVSFAQRMFDGTASLHVSTYFVSVALNGAQQKEKSELQLDILLNFYAYEYSGVVWRAVGELLSSTA